MLQEIRNKAATHSKSSPSFQPFPSHATDRKRDDYTRTFMRARHIQEVAHRQSMDFRSLQKCPLVSVPDFDNCLSQTRKDGQ
jgi:hypothetical protein